MINSHASTHRAALLSVATAVPLHSVDQTLVAQEAMLHFLPRYAEFAPLARVFDTAGIRKRHTVKPMAWYKENRGWPERTDAYIEGAESLFIAACRLALQRAGLEAHEIDTIVTVSSTGIATPSLEARVSDTMGFRSDAARVPVFGLGCAGGVTGLAIAAKLAESRPGINVLLAAVELCSLAIRLDKFTKANVVATALFADGAAACVLRAGDGGIAAVEASGEHRWPHTLNLMGWAVESEGFGVIFDREIPPFARQHMGSAVTDLLDRHGLGCADIGRFVCHPGGAKVVDALEEALELPPGRLDHERAVLADYGNMSAPTVFFVLERVLDDQFPDRTCLLSLGPGFTASCVVLRKC